MTAEEFKTEVKRLCPALLGVAVGYIKNTDEAEDMVQEAMLKLWTMCAELRSPIAPLARVLTRNLCIDRIRRRTMTVNITVTDMADSGVEAAEHERVERMMGVIDTLPSAQQIVLRLRHIDGMSFADIAELTGGTEVGVRKAISRARMAVRDAYFKQEKEEMQR